MYNGLISRKNETIVQSIALLRNIKHISSFHLFRLRSLWFCVEMTREWNDSEYNSQYISEYISEYYSEYTRNSTRNNNRRYTTNVASSQFIRRNKWIGIFKNIMNVRRLENINSNYFLLHKNNLSWKESKAHSAYVAYIDVSPIVHAPPGTTRKHLT